MRISDWSSDVCSSDLFVHGGVLGFLADNAMAGAASTMRPEGKDVLTSEYKLNLLRPAIGDRITARGEVVKAGRTQCVVEARIYARDKGEEKLVAIALGTDRTSVGAGQSGVGSV